MIQFLTGATGGQSGLIPPWSDTVHTYALVATTAKSVTVPVGATFMVVSATADFWVNTFGATAVIPSADNTTGTGTPVLNPTQRKVVAGQVLSFISATSQQITIEWFGN